jgi:predicted aspartyl protease
MSNPALSQEELQQIQEIRKQMVEVASTLGELSFQETVISIEKQKLTEVVKNAREREKALLNEFGKKYGDGVINLETGEIELRP